MSLAVGLFYAGRRKVPGSLEEQENYRTRYVPSFSFEWISVLIALRSNKLVDGDLLVKFTQNPASVEPIVGDQAA